MGLYNLLVLAKLQAEDQEERQEGIDVGKLGNGQITEKWDDEAEDENAE